MSLSTILMVVNVGLSIAASLVNQAQLKDRVEKEVSKQVKCDKDTKKGS